ncbi:hypothetical protein INT45_013919 [Circinella minor]|uniref:N-acetyltransferase domain-containing protein n=1 Tax=Circinella minor TaxID=1195481 RepID=A0A8H7RZC1_9FUNG|nr:hypothetical protein INT45_013919 [Circinella minor]
MRPWCQRFGDMTSNTKPKQLKSGYHVRPASLKDLSRIHEITDVVNTSYLSEGGWTTDRPFITGNSRITPQEIKRFIHETIADYPGYYKKRALLQLTFERKSKEEQDHIIGVALTKIIENEFEEAHLLDTTKDDNNVTNEHNTKYNSGVTVIYSVLPKYQSSGIGVQMARLTFAYAREFMKCRSLLGYKIVGVMDYPYRHLIKGNFIDQ